MPADEQQATGAAESSETTEGAVESENSGSGLSFTADQSRVLSEASRSVAGNPVKAKAMAGNLLKNFAVGTPEWEAVADVIGKANIKIMMDKVPCDKNVEYTVVSGDSFIRISNKFDTTNLLIWKVNGIPENSSHLGIGDKLTIYKNSGWHIEILKSKGLLCVYDGPELFKVYRAGISSKNPPAGEYTLPGSKKRVMDAGGDPVFSDFSQMLYWFAEKSVRPAMLRSDDEDGTVRFSLGKTETGEVERKASSVVPVPSGYPSWPLDGGMQSDSPTGDDVASLPVGERGRLKFSADAADYFSCDGNTGVIASNRLKGIVLHDVLSRVTVPGDLRRALSVSMCAGDMDESESEEAFALLSGRIAGVSRMGWFPSDPSGVSTEVTLIDTDGSLYRPDRMVVAGDSVIIVDYKFGEPRRSHERQVARYADICRRMGYREVSAFLWYVFTDEVVLCSK